MCLDVKFVTLLEVADLLDTGNHMERARERESTGSILHMNERGDLKNFITDFKNIPQNFSNIIKCW